MTLRPFNFDLFTLPLVRLTSTGTESEIISVVAGVVLPAADFSS